MYWFSVWMICPLSFLLLLEYCWFPPSSPAEPAQRPLWPLAFVLCLYRGAPVLGTYTYLKLLCLLGLIPWSICSVLPCLFNTYVFTWLHQLLGTAHRIFDLCCKPAWSLVACSVRTLHLLDLVFWPGIKPQRLVLRASVSHLTTREIPFPYLL